MTLTRKYSINKKVKEHNKKLKKLAKFKPTRKGPRKEPPIPAACPFKEQLLERAEQLRDDLKKEKEEKKKIQAISKKKAQASAKGE
ncbi:hypothetical protein BLNAU_2941 [Blattamonas nauphoetae]|uniref:Guanine nucleotide-binding protein-like 3 N-terminal domain-containing protein n=1 Tax=Blattamonas nauphoetae TaxID=2049346 RepID=A0ABQ9YES3_9EUKA|nr:hypothetical protein BLNAU_2941 [Blattamonas nauphoetae]